jgi:dTDP-4-amino-4,6-dideoxygalactose transaminase
MKIQMVDLKTQFRGIEAEVTEEMLEVIKSAAFINGPVVGKFKDALSQYLDDAFVIPCANGTDALQIALMSLDLDPGDEIIVPAFTFIASVEVIALLKFKPVVIDVEQDSFNIDVSKIPALITERTKAIMPVHLFGQSCDMESMVKIAEKHNLHIIEDNAQSIGARYKFSNGNSDMTGTIGTIGTTSFYPSKNLGCFGDGGAISTRDEILAEKLRTIANHGQVGRYYHEMIGVNSRLDSLQAAILKVKLKRLDLYIERRQQAAAAYDHILGNIDEVIRPVRKKYSTHVFHQYTIQVKPNERNALKQHLQDDGIPSMIYYPVPLHKQKAFQSFIPANVNLPITDNLCKSVLSLPMHTELSDEAITFIGNSIRNFFTKHKSGGRLLHTSHSGS